MQTVCDSCMDYLYLFLVTEAGFEQWEGSLQSCLKFVWKTAFCVTTDTTNAFSFLFSDIVLRDSSDNC